MKNTLLAFTLLALVFGCSTSKPPQTNSLDASPTLLTLGTNQVKVNEFKYVYNKNNASTPDAYTEKSLREYLELYTNFRLKILAAEAEVFQDSPVSLQKHILEYLWEIQHIILSEDALVPRQRLAE